MILKNADDHSSQLGQLEQRLTDRTLNAAQRQWLTDELFRLRMGIQGERDAAFYLNSHFKDSDNHVVIHDLRVEVDGDVAQIDHLVFYRAGGIYLFETKNYGGSLLINDHGEFTADYGRVRYGIPSPIEQSRRHERVLHKLLDRLDIGGRTQRQLEMHHLVLVHPKAIIKRPAEKVFSTHNVMKADQFPAWHKKRTDHIGTLEIFSLLANMRSVDTLREWGEKLIRQHRPAPLRPLPEHLFPAASPAPSPMQPAVPASAPTDSAQLARKLVCAECGARITFAEGKFCWGNERRFGGLQYCREHQARFR